MLKNNFVGHVSPTTGQLKDRFFAARIRAAKMSENVAFHRSVPEAHEGLMNSPGTARTFWIQPSRTWAWAWSRARRARST